MNATKGILYGLGVGPGDPELITLKAARVLNTADVVFAAASTKNAYSLALSIARPHIPDTTPVRMLNFPMNNDEAERQQAWRRHALTIIAEVRSGSKAAFITLGDAMTYSTFGYVLSWFRQLAPELPVVSIPGITSYQAAAACLNEPLVEGEESLLVTSGANGGDRLREISTKPDCVVFLKAYRHVNDIADAIEDLGGYSPATAVVHCGLEQQEVITDIRQLGDRRPNYWTLILAKQKHVQKTPQS
ncbi:MAG: precorrin-2 C(20)-methyltransferase [Desulfobacterales bacterium]